MQEITLKVYILHSEMTFSQEIGCEYVKWLAIEAVTYISGEKITGPD